MLGDAEFQATIPAADLGRARTFYEDLGSERAAWFKDTEGNILSVGQFTQA